MTPLSTTGTLSDGTDLDYACDVYVDVHRGMRRIQHGGGWGGYRAQLVTYPDERTSIVVLANVRAVDITGLIEGITTVVRPAAPPAATQPTTPQATVTTDVFGGPLDLATHAGTFVDHDAGVAVQLVADEDGHPSLSFGPSAVPLHPAGPRRWSARAAL